jgi:hypothetical protein
VKPEEEDSDGEEVDFEQFERRSGLIDLDGRIHIMVGPGTGG